MARRVPRLCQLAASKRRRRNTIPTCAYIPSVTYFAHWPSQRGHQRRRKSTCTTRMLNLGCAILPFYWFKTNMFVCVCVCACLCVLYPFEAVCDRGWYPSAGAPFWSYSSGRGKKRWGIRYLKTIQIWLLGLVRPRYVPAHKHCRLF